MNRRKAIGALAASPLLAAETSSNRQYYELRYYQLRNGYSKNPLPSKKPAGLGTVGAFSPVIAENSPFLVMLIAHPSFADTERSAELEVDYLRCEKTLLRAFAGMPELRLPPAPKSGRIFELRTYESNNASTLQTKIDMFNNGEMGIFERLGMSPVFFGEALFGSRLPHLTYMLAFDDLAARDRLWTSFGSDPEWLKLRSKPGLSDADIVSNISNMILRPAPFSDIR